MVVASVAVCFASVDAVRAKSAFVAALLTLVDSSPSSPAWLSTVAFVASRSEAVASAFDCAAAAACLAASAFASAFRTSSACFEMSALAAEAISLASSAAA